MAMTPILKVYSPRGEYVASCKYLVDAAMVAGMYGMGAKVRKGHNGKTLWHEGHESLCASDSFDGAAKVMETRW